MPVVLQCTWRVAERLSQLLDNSICKAWLCHYVMSRAVLLNQKKSRMGFVRMVGSFPFAALRLGEGCKSNPYTRACVALLGATVLVGCSAVPEGVDEMESHILTQLDAGLPPPSVAAEFVPPNIADSFVDSVGWAVQQNPGYRAAVFMEKEALSSIGIANSARRPQVSGDASVGGIFQGDPISDTTAGVAGSLTLSQLIYDGGRVDGAITRSTAQAVAARAERLDRGNKIALEAARAWVDIWQLDLRMTWLSEKTGQMDELVSQIERMTSNGMLDRASLDSAKRQIVDIELQRSALQSQIANAQTQFKRFFGLEVERLKPPMQVLSVTAAKDAAEAWKTAPVIRRSAAELLAARGAEKEAAAASKPNVSLQVGALSPMDADDTTDLTAGIRVGYTFGDGGRRKAQLEASQARVAALEEKLADDWLAAEAQMDAALEKLFSLEASMALIGKKIELSSSEAQTARSQIATGQSNLRQLVEAEIENYRARDQQIQMLAEQHVLLLEIAAGAGLLTGLLGLDDG